MARSDLAERSRATSDGPATVLYSISYFYDVFGTAIRAFTRRLPRSRAIFDGGRNVFGWWCPKTYTGHQRHGAICLGKKSAFSLRAYGDSGAKFTQRNTGLRGEKWTPGVPVTARISVGLRGVLLGANCTMELISDRTDFCWFKGGPSGCKLHNGTHK